ncbi:MAG: c-type cytochrome [Gemmatimonadota bacterium]
MKILMRYAAVLLILAMAACGGGDSAPPAEEAEAPAETAPAQEAAMDMELPEGVTAAMVTEGEEIFNGSVGICWTCHLQDGAGGPLAPNLTDDEWLNIDGSYESIVQNIITGVAEPKEHPGVMLPRAGMPLTDEQVNAVGAYVWTLSNGS